MAERILNPHEIRIVASNGATHTPPARSPSDTRTARLSRLLACAAAAPAVRPAINHGAQSEEYVGEPARELSTLSAQRSESNDAQECALGGVPLPDPASEAAPVMPRALPEAQPVGSRRPVDMTDSELGKQIAQTWATALHAEVFTRELSDRIARFCKTAGTSDDMPWSVTLPMNPSVVPDTLLHLQLSPSSLAIRFETSSARSAHLISNNADALRVRLNETFDRRLDITISV